MPKSYIFIVLALQLVSVMLVDQVRAAAFKIAPEWKAHFKNTPIIENCVFERKIFSDRGETNLYQFRYQENAYLIRQIRSLDDVSSNYIPGMAFSAGHVGSNFWVIESGGVLKQFPNLEQPIRNPQNGDVALLFFAERYIFSTLYYGINNLDPQTLEWPEDLKFTALSIQGQKCYGEIIETSGGLPTVLKWHTDQAQRIQFILEYQYDTNLSLPYYPREMRLFKNIGGTKSLSSVLKLLMLKTSELPLGEDVYDSRHYVAPSHNGNPTTIVFTNNGIYALTKESHLERVLTNGIPGFESDNKRTRPVQFAIIVLFAFSLVGLFFVVKQRRQTK